MVKITKLLKFSTALLTSSLLFSSAHAMKLHCEATNGAGNLASGGFIYEASEYSYRCVSHNTGQPFSMDFYGVGGALYFDLMSKLDISCPLVRESKVQKKGLKFFGPKLEADLALGGMVSLTFGSRGAVCAIAGVNLGFGAAATLDYFNIKPLSVDGPESAQ